MENSKTEVVCCFCGENLPLESAVLLIYALTTQSEDAKFIYAHRSCFDATLHESIPRLLHDDE